MKKVSIVTVCYNAEKQIEKTLESVFSQDYEEIEYIIKDGNSEDNTNQLIEKYKVMYENGNIDLKHIICNDNGIYDAMNQAIRSCSDSNYVLFLNAGDTLYDEHVIKQLMKINENADILAGLTSCSYLHGINLISEPCFKKNAIEFCHQSILVKTNLMKKYGFDISYNIAADRDLLLKLLQNKCSICYLNMVIARYKCDGVSSKRHDVLYEELDRINEIYGIEQKKHNKVVNMLKVFFTRYIPEIADFSAIYKKLKRSR